MQTSIDPNLLQTAAGKEAEAILRSCVHCGFCTATCPTYQLLGDELDGPRGRIYQIKQILEGAEPALTTQAHLDRCLACRSCETTCPSGVRYHRLLEIGKAELERRQPRSLAERIKRRVMLSVIPYPTRFTPLLRLGQMARPLMPPALKRRIPAWKTPGRVPTRPHNRTMLVLNGCAQSGIAPNINAAATRVLDRLGIRLQGAPEAGCCGAMHHHMNDEATGLGMARRNIDAWWPMIEAGAEAIVMTASGCGTQVKEYGELLADDPDYADKAIKVSSLTRDLSEILSEEDLGGLRLNGSHQPSVAFHTPCSLHHGQQLNGRVEGILGQLGFTLTLVRDAHLCCGSAGAYSMLQPEIAGQLRKRKLTALLGGKPTRIATANIGCLTHLASGTDVEVLHWIELLDSTESA
ncbi:MAG: glycolate oxidase subunit GlcF [Gammaproteobacteria bacterium]|nr:glycolate oxidase subunit GlcF [Gammaproteobacteria bacterium]MCP5135714.1 glycolate oxidase subunit GlcF [Gammaproteobacteria bacterium]